MSEELVPAGKVAGFATGGTGMGMTSEQSMRSALLWPVTAILAMAYKNPISDGKANV